MDYKLELLAQAQATEFPYFGSSAGDGIVYVGGGKYWPMIVAGIRVLRDTGCTLPVEVWYRGKCEEVEHKDIEGLNVRLCDVDGMASVFGDSRIPTGRVCKGGWEAKLYAIYHTNFDRILFLDADAYCINDPRTLFHLLTPDEPFVYWKDLPAQANVVRWDDVYEPGKRAGVPQVQGGQLIIDRIKCQSLIHVCNWMCQHSEYFFKKFYGDQDTWRVGLALGLAGYTCLVSIKWVQGIAFKCSYGDTDYILHRCKGKLFEPQYIPPGNQSYSNPHYALPYEHELFTYFAQVVNGKEGTAEQAFSEIYKRKLWGTDYPSGNGSSLKEGQPYIDTVNRLIKELGIKSVVDVGCGDGLIGSKIKCEGYIGVDCYKDLIDKNNKKYPENTYLHIDILTEYDTIPVGDCLLCKDVLHHWPTDSIKRFLDFLIRSKKWKYAILCQDFKQLSENQDCHLGGYRGLSFKLSPLCNYPFAYTTGVGHKTLGLLRLDNADESDRARID